VGLNIRIMTWLFGPMCPDGCGQHVYPKDVEWHRAEHCQAVRHG
jgi:hypothetical protein